MNFEINPIFIYILNMILLILNCYFIFLFKKRKTNKNLEPLKLPYYMAGFLIKGKNSAIAFILSTVIKFSINGNISIERKDYINKKGKEKENYLIRGIDSHGCDKNEKYLYDLLFSLDNPISTRKLNNLRISNGLAFNEKFSLYLDELEKYAYEFNLIYKNKDRKKPYIYIGLSFLDFVVSFITISQRIYISVILLILGFLILFISLRLLGENPPLGMATYNYYVDYEKLLLSKDVYSENELLFALAFDFKLDKIMESCQKVNEYLPFIKIFKNSLIGNF